MSQRATSVGQRDAMWRGIDFSGLTVVLGVGTGRLIGLLNQQVAISEGNLIVVSYKLDALKALGTEIEGPLALFRARPRQIPVLSETVDLLVVNGVLRQVPEGKLEIMFGELWRALVPGGQLRISDIIEPSEAEYNQAWIERNRIVNRLSQALEREAALSVDLKRAALAVRSAGFENLALSILPGYVLTEAWLEQTVEAVRAMASRVVDRSTRNEILSLDLKRLVAAYNRGGQRAAERFVMRGTKAGDLALNMEASFTEEDLLGSEW